MNEPDDSVSLMVRLIEGTISEGRNILVRITTADGLAQGKLLHVISLEFIILQ